MAAPRWRICGCTARPARCPAERLAEERRSLQPLPAPYRGAIAAARPRVRRLTEALVLPARLVKVVPPQHELHLYDRLLEVA